MINIVIYSWYKFITYFDADKPCQPIYVGSIEILFLQGAFLYKVINKENRLGIARPRMCIRAIYCKAEGECFFLSFSKVYMPPDNNTRRELVPFYRAFYAISASERHFYFLLIYYALSIILKLIKIGMNRFAFHLTRLLLPIFPMHMCLYN